jgi:hypothetical protein
MDGCSRVEVTCFAGRKMQVINVKKGKRLTIFIDKEGELGVLQTQHGQKSKIAYSRHITLGTNN